MNDHKTVPPDEDNPNATPSNIESILCGMEIKQEPTIKQEPEDDDGIVMVSRLTYTANGVRPHNFIRDHKMDASDNFFVLCGPTEVKNEVKTEKDKNKVNKVSQKSPDRDHPPQNIANIYVSKQKEQKSRESVGEAKKRATEVEKNRKTSSCGDKKKPTEGAANGKRHNCLVCEFVASRKHHLESHMVKHTGERPFPCSICPKRFTIKRNLQSHMKIHIDQFLFNCPICLKGFQHSEEKVEHEAGCKVRRYECLLCKEYSTFFKTNLEVHIRTHSGEKPFECNHCSRKFTNAGNVERHRRIHTNPPYPLKFKCSVCFKNFARQSEKENHEVNCKRRGYECDVCKHYKTDSKSHLVEHMRIHSGERQFQCEICSKCFTQKSALNRHKKIHK